jgi:hypothetical protein
MAIELWFQTSSALLHCGWILMGLHQSAIALNIQQPLLGKRLARLGRKRCHRLSAAERFARLVNLVVQNIGDDDVAIARLDKTRDLRWNTLSTQERVQLGRLAQRPSTLLDSLLALQAMA